MCLPPVPGPASVPPGLCLRFLRPQLCVPVPSLFQACAPALCSRSLSVLQALQPQAQDPSSRLCAPVPLCSQGSPDPLCALCSVLQAQGSRLCALCPFVQCPSRGLCSGFQALCPRPQVLVSQGFLFQSQAPGSVLQALCPSLRFMSPVLVPGSRALCPRLCQSVLRFCVQASVPSRLQLH
jgi:hypothetical protein